MNPWSTDPCWQNFSSLFQEVTATTEASNEIGRYHHMTASLYFGVAALEAFINQKMRLHLSCSRSEQEILSVLRKGTILDKLKKWPKEILSTEMRVSDSTMQLLSLFNEIRGNLTHPKTDGRDIYARLEEIESESVFLAVAEYMVRFYEAQGVVFPYWLFGWNYLNPRPDSHEIILINNQQFLHSLNGLGFNVPAWTDGEQWQALNMKSYENYLNIKGAIDAIGHCEKKNDRFPYQPKLCRRWWKQEHHCSCGYVTQTSIKKSNEFDY